MNDNEYIKYMNSYMKLRWKKRRKLAVQKLGGSCAKCGDSKNLQFDHINPKTKKFTIACGSSYSEAKFWEEIGKCQLLCIECHKKKSSIESEKRRTHGKAHTAFNCKCTCTLCLDFRVKYAAERRRKRKERV